MATSRKKTIEQGTKVKIVEVTDRDRYSDVGRKLATLTGVALAPLKNNGDNTYTGAVRIDRLPSGRGMGYVGDTIAARSTPMGGSKGTARRDAFFDAVKLEIIG